MMCGGHCWRTVAAPAEEDSYLREGTAEMVGVGKIVTVGLENQVMWEAVGMIELAWLFSRRKAEDR